jgi:hypothetical protein
VAARTSSFCGGEMRKAMNSITASEVQSTRENTMGIISIRGRLIPV